MNCQQPGCTGQIVDGYCDVCGMAPSKAPAPRPAPSEMTVAATGTSRRSGSTRTRMSSRRRLGAGLVEIPATPTTDPLDAVLSDPSVPESRRFCSGCEEPVGRSRDGAPGRTSGFCRKCGTAFSFEPKLQPGLVVAGQYEVAGCLAHGGMGWIYLARDRAVSDRWVVLKGILNAGDRDAATAALAERRFLARVDESNIVKIFNFIEHEGSGYIVMEYVGGRSLKQILTARREANGGQPDPLPVAHAVAYMHEILPALGYLHEMGLLFCDFKVDNVIQTQRSLKLIDLGGVYQISEPSSAVFGTVGYQAPEIATAGPSISSDLFTVARTLAVLCTDFRGYTSTFRFTLPPRESVPVFQRFDSLYRLLLKATAPDPDDRFQSADEMADQLYEVLREVVASEEDRPVPGPSTLFTDPLRASVDRPDWRVLPRPQVSTDDASAGYIAAVSPGDPEQMIRQLLAAPERTVEVDLRIAAVKIESGAAEEADRMLAEIQAADRWEWRAGWYRGLAELARHDPATARAHFERVLDSVPGELPPKLALGMACELDADTSAAAGWYEIVARTDPSVTSASFGLARCRLTAGDRAGAIEAYERVPESSSGRVDAEVARIRALSAPDGPGAPSLDDLLAAGAILDGLPLEEEQQDRLSAQVLGAALTLTQRDPIPDPERISLLGRRLIEDDLRLGLEDCYRALARRTRDRAERIRLVDQANRTRPRTWV